MQKKIHNIPTGIKILIFFILPFVLISCSPKSIKPADSELFFSLEKVRKLEKFVDKSRFKYKEGRVTDKFIPSAEYSKVIPYIGRFYHEYREDLPVFGFVDADGFIITDAVYPVLDKLTLLNGTELFVAAYNHKGLIVIPQNGEWMLESVESNRYYCPPMAYSNGLFGLINENLDTEIYNCDGVLQRVIEDRCVYYSDSLCVINSDDTFRLQKPDGSYINDITYYSFNGFHSGCASVSIKTSPVRRVYSAAVIDTSGNYVIKPTGYRIIDISTMDTGIMRVLDNNNRYGIIDIDGNELVPCVYPQMKIESTSPLIFTTNNKRINYSEGTETDYTPLQDSSYTLDFGSYDYRITICGYTCAVLNEYTYVFDSEGELLFKKLIHETD